MRGLTLINIKGVWKHGTFKGIPTCKHLVFCAKHCAHNFSICLTGTNMNYLETPCGVKMSLCVKYNLGANIGSTHLGDRNIAKRPLNSKADVFIHLLINDSYFYSQIVLSSEKHLCPASCFPFLTAYLSFFFPSVFKHMQCYNIIDVYPLQICN